MNAAFARRAVKFAIEDLDQLRARAVADGWDIRYIQLEGGRYFGVYWGLELPGLYLTRRIHGRNLHVSGTATSGTVPVVVPFGACGTILNQGETLSADRVSIWRPAQELDVTMGGPVDLAIIQMEPKKFEEVVQTLALGEDGPGFPARVVNTPKPRAYGALRRILHETLYKRAVPTSEYVTPAAQHALAAELIQALTATFASCMQGRSGPSARDCQSGPRHARSARDFMEANRDRPLSLYELCQETGAGLRTLNYVFKDYFGIPPLQYHKLRRLNGVRDTLSRRDPTEVSVTMSATEWGFWHLGRFSVDYKAVFGESPSHTLARRARLPRPGFSPPAAAIGTGIEFDPMPSTGHFYAAGD